VHGTTFARLRQRGPDQFDPAVATRRGERVGLLCRRRARGLGQLRPVGAPAQQTNQTFELAVRGDDPPARAVCGLDAARQGRIYADFAESQWYAEPKRLARLGYLASRTEPGRTRPRTHYTLTVRGV
jgi:hypothetical protein